MGVACAGCGVRSRTRWTQGCFTSAYASSFALWQRWPCAVCACQACEVNKTLPCVLCGGGACQVSCTCDVGIWVAVGCVHTLFCHIVAVLGLLLLAAHDAGGSVPRFAATPQIRLILFSFWAAGAGWGSKHRHPGGLRHLLLAAYHAGGCGHASAPHACSAVLRCAFLFQRH